MNHSKLPWKIYDDCYLSIKDADKEDVCKLYYTAHYGDVDMDNYEANAEFICKAVNNHDALVESLLDCMDALHGYNYITNEAEKACDKAFNLLNHIKGE